jgi:hypothetical protein
MEWQPDASELDRVDRALAAQLTSASGLSLRATLLGGVSALSMLLLGLFATAWLDDATWELSDIADTAMQVSLLGAVFGLAVCLLFSLAATFPRRSWSDVQGERLGALRSGDRGREGELGLRMVDELRQVNAKKAKALKIGSWALGIAFVAMVVHGAVFVLDAAPAEGRLGAAPVADADDPPARADEAELAARYAPRVWLHSDERLGPIDPDAFVAASKLRWLGRRDRPTVSERPDPRRLGRGCASAPGGCHRHDGWVASELTRPYSASAERASGLLRARGFFLDPPDDVRRGVLGDEIDVPMLYELRRLRGELLITYWFFYGHSRPFINVGSDTRHNLLDVAHEGDWENVDVALVEDGAGGLQPKRVLFYGHGHPVSRAWERVERTGTHPVVYSALNSHASYPVAAERRGDETKVCGPVGCSHDFRNEGMRWDGWVEGRLRPARAQPWYGFGGAWGAAGELPDTTGPLGPSRWKLPSDPEPGELASVR